MRLLMRIVNVLCGLLALASGVTVLVSNLTDAGYRAHYGDSLPLVLAYVVFYGWVVMVYARDRGPVAWLTVAKTLGAYLFVGTFAVAGSLWMARTPGRYVYQLFDWGPGVTLVLIAFVMLGRGVWNTLNAMFFTAPWWTQLRRARPLVGRLVTSVFVALVVLFAWSFQQLTQLEADTFSVEAHEVAQFIHGTIDCDAIDEHRGSITRDVRQRKDRRYDVEIRYNCHDTQVVVRDPDGRLGQFRGPKQECCAADAVVPGGAAPTDDTPGHGL